MDREISNMAYPQYISSLYEYILLNLRENNIDISQLQKVIFAIRVFPDSPIFSMQCIYSNGEKRMLDCWKIFDLALQILKDDSREWNRLKIILKIADGKICKNSLSLSK